MEHLQGAETRLSVFTLGGLDVVTSGSLTRHARRFYSDERLRGVFEQLHDTYDMVVVVAPSLPSQLGISVASNTDGVVLVVPEGDEHSDDILDMVATAHAEGLSVQGLVTVDEPRRGHRRTASSHADGTPGEVETDAGDVRQLPEPHGSDQIGAGSGGSRGAGSLAP